MSLKNRVYEEAGFEEKFQQFEEQAQETCFEPKRMSWVDEEMEESLYQN